MSGELYFSFRSPEIQPLTPSEEPRLRRSSRPTILSSGGIRRLFDLRVKQTFDGLHARLSREPVVITKDARADRRREGPPARRSRT